MAEAQRENVRAIRPGISIPEQRAEDITSLTIARVARGCESDAYRLAQTEPNSEAHLTSLDIAGIASRLPRNNLRLLVTPITPREEWFSEAAGRVAVARAEKDLAESRWSLAYMLDRQDGGNRNDDLQAERSRCQRQLDQAIEDALRTPTVRKFDATRKQDMIGRREWAAEYRPDWQVIVDEDLARYPAKARTPRTQEGALT